MFIDAELDICPAFGWQGGPSFNTRVATTQAWMERRNANNISCRHSYSLPLQNIVDDDYLTLLKQVFMACRGQLHSFKVKDYADFEAVNEVFGEGDGATLSFQLSKTSNFGAAAYVRVITKPSENVFITVDGTVTAATIDYNTGIVTFAVAPASGALLRWSGEFRVPVRFNSDVLNTTIDNKSADGDFIINGSVDLIEVFAE
jgi:uncharacterized protein (TIGR02217 family)